MELLKRMIREEWRMHSRLFGSTMFAGFPVLITLLSAGIFYLLASYGVTAQGIHTGLHYVVFFLGLNVGAIGFISRDAIKNLLGESNLLIFSSRTLPISRHTIIVTYLIKDLLYYSFLYLLPIHVGLGIASFYMGAPVGVLGLLFLTTSGSFMLGVALSFLTASVYIRGRAFFLAELFALGFLTFWFQEGLIEFTPLAFFETATLGDLFFGFGPIFLLTYLGLLTFHHRAQRRQERRFDEMFSRMNPYTGFNTQGMVTKSLMDVSRSSGGIWKVFFSEAMIFLLFAYGAQKVPLGQSFLQGPLLSFSVLLGLASVSTYNWLNRFDHGENYLKFPIDHGTIFHAKIISFMLIALPISYVLLSAAGLLFGFEGGAGLLVLPGVMLYVVGVTAYLAGLEPNKMLFNTKLFMLYTFVLALAVVPLFVVSIAYGTYPDLASALAAAIAVLAGAAGYKLHRRAGRRWEKRFKDY